MNQPATSAPGVFETYVHSYSPHSSVALYAAAGLCSICALAAIYLRCRFTKSTDHLDEKWIFQTVASAATIPTYALLILIPFDSDLARCVLEDRVVVALAGILGLVETLKDIRGTASKAHRKKNAAAR